MSVYTVCNVFFPMSNNFFLFLKLIHFLNVAFKNSNRETFAESEMRREKGNKE